MTWISGSNKSCDVPEHIAPQGWDIACQAPQLPLWQGLVVVGRQVGPDKLASPVRMQVHRHVIVHLLHVKAHLVKRRSRDEVALAVDLPGDGRVLRAHGVVSTGAGSRAGVDGNVAAHVTIDDHAADEVGVVVVFIVDDGEDLPLHAHSTGDVLRRETQKHLRGEATEDAIVERGLVLMRGAASTRRRVRPVNLIRLPHVHSHAMLPIVLGGVHGLIRVILLASVAVANLRFSEPPVRVWVGVGGIARKSRAHASLVVLARGSVLRAEVPMHVDRAQRRLVVAFHDRRHICVDVAHVALGNIRARLLPRLPDAILEAIPVVQVTGSDVLLAVARVGAETQPLRGIGDDPEAHFFARRSAALLVLVKRLQPTTGQLA
mmetsp:Transcript_111927/g.281674  ORF Transcript_111927/g.281674 Transcript_111927/m.281674 type:complete len:376 (-) Transcript_111927:188-1315(-)